MLSAERCGGEKSYEGQKGIKMANEKRLIDAYAFEEYHCNGCPYRREGSCTNDDPICATIDDLREAPTVDAVEAVHGRWIDEYPYVRCSECNVEWLNCRTDNEPKLFYYCPNCGADMRERTEDGTKNH